MENKVKELKLVCFGWSCGCLIIGSAPVVSKIMLCTRHRHDINKLREQMLQSTPDTLKKMVYVNEFEG